MNTETLKNAYRRDNWRILLNDLFGVNFKAFGRVEDLQVENHTAKAVVQLGEITLASGDVLAVYEVELQEHIQIERNKVAIRNLLRTHWNKYDGAFIASYKATESIWRFSYVSETRQYDTEGNYGKVVTAAKRFTYVLGQGERIRTATDRFLKLAQTGKNATLEDIKGAFNVGPLSTEFFNEYKAQYKKFCDFMENDATMQQDFREFLVDGTNKAIRDYVKKMLGRIVFLHFLQKKGWMGVPCESTKWKGGNPNFMEELYAKSTPTQQANFLDEILEPLFFHSLNKARPNDWYDTKTGLGIVKVPYLNGGLFEPEKLDEPDSKFPAKYFSDLFAFFNKYNFTIEENDPRDAEVGVDPEMLGHIFENLLEDNKDKGAFYTPKEIVHYMCQESLTEYLCTALKIESDEERQPIEQLVKYHEVSEKLKSRLKEIKLALDKVKICDPAIGSGAFPMGLLQEIFAIKQALWLYEHNNLDQFPACDEKQRIIQNSIYGVDIEKGAVDIARLRFWLSLVVNETTPQPLPNLDYKIMQGNSLIESFDGHDLSQIIQSNKNKTSQLTMGFDSDLTVQNLNMLLKDYFKTNNSEEKTHKKKQIEEQVKEHIKNCAGHTPEIIKKVNSIDFNNKSFFLWHLYFADVFENGGFDIVIGNPPYIQLQKDGGKLADLYKNGNYETYERTGDIYALFYERGMQLLKENGSLNYITSNKWMRASYGESLRKFFIRHNPLKLIDLGSGVFDNATVDTNIIIVSNATNQNICIALDLSKEKKITNFEQFSESWTPLLNLTKDSWAILSKIENTIKQKIERIGKPLKEWDINIYRGVLTGFNEAFIIDTPTKERLCKEDQRSAEIIKPILRGKDIKKYQAIWAGLWLIFIPWHFPLHNDPTITGNSEKAESEFEKQYPAIYHHLLKFKPQLSARNRAETGIRYEWFALQRCAATYFDEFEKEKIVWNRIASEKEFSLVEKGMLIQDSMHFFTGSNLNLLIGILSSKVIKWLLSFIIGDSAGGNAGNADNIKILTIPELTEIKQQPFIDLVNQILEGKKSENDTTYLERQIDELVFKLYDLTYEEVLVVCPDFWLSEAEYKQIKIE
jgi:adenine-specific DNA-methyltransferase